MDRQLKVTRTDKPDRREGQDPTVSRRRWFAAPLLLVAALVGAVALVATTRVSQTHTPRYILTANVNFPVSGVIYSGPVSSDPTVGCSGGADVLYPGTPRCLRYKVTNPLNVTISVTSLTITNVTFSPYTTNTSLPPCQATDLDTSKAAFAPTSASGYLPVTSGSTAYVGEAISLKDDGNQTNCEQGTFGFTVTGRAQYTASTTTTLTGNPNPSAVGSTVTLTATVATATSGATTPQGRVTFNQCANPSCTSPAPTALGTVALSSGSASFTTSPLMTAGNFYFQAVYNPATIPSTNTNWSTSSGLLTQVVQGASCVNIPTSGATVITGTYSGNYEVKNNSTLWLDGGTITGNMTVDAKGQLTTSGGSIKGYVTSLGGPVALQGTSVGGNVQTTNASLGLGPNTTVGGKVQPSGGTVLCSSGSSAGSVHIGNIFQIQSLGATANPVTICNTEITGNLQYTGNAAPAILGGSSGCTGNRVAGNFQVQTNTAKLTIGGVGIGYGNTAAGNIQVQSNTGGGTLTSNASTGGNCQLGGNKPGIVGAANSAAKQNTCNATA